MPSPANNKDISRTEKALLAFGLVIVVLGASVLTLRPSTSGSALSLNPTKWFASNNTSTSEQIGAVLQSDTTSGADVPGFMKVVPALIRVISGDGLPDTGEGDSTQESAASTDDDLPPAPGLLASYPDPNNTGPAQAPSQPYTSTNVSNDAYLITQSIDGQTFDRCIQVTGSDITISNSTINGDCETPVINDTGSGNSYINNTIIGAGAKSAAGVLCSDCVISGNNISNAVDGIKLGSNQVIQDNYIHNLSVGIVGGNPTHNDGMQSQGGTNVTIRHNTIDGSFCPAIGTDGGACNTAIFIKVDPSPVSGYVIEDNQVVGAWPYYGVRSCPGTEATVQNNKCQGSFTCETRTESC